ncbi:ATP-dependent DNA helicase PIF1 [Zootermopsis nevadensis]|uniref:ATP-dependent DNA helicase n=1 Tax=Zootermopsis nevadensis TaxID=136037 RepID=A0A067RSX6_ZOONE|nr:ATP-dependent DNA helicase PIF1 [Zootermopsis nevadensis]
MSRKQGGLSRETLQMYRSAFHNVEMLFMDEVSMIGTDILHTINARLQTICNEYDKPFGGMTVIFCGDLRQLPPVNANFIYKPHKNSLAGANLWQSLSFLT